MLEYASHVDPEMTRLRIDDQIRLREFLTRFRDVPCTEAAQA